MDHLFDMDGWLRYIGASNASSFVKFFDEVWDCCKWSQIVLGWCKQLDGHSALEHFHIEFHSC